MLSGGDRPPGRSPRRTTTHGPLTAAAIAARAPPSPSLRQRGDAPRTTARAPAAASAIPSTVGAVRTGSAATPASCCTTSDAVASSLLASRRSIPASAVAPQSASSAPVPVASQAPSSSALQSSSAPPTGTTMAPTRCHSKAIPAGFQMACAGVRGAAHDVHSDFVARERGRADRETLLEQRGAPGLDASGLLGERRSSRARQEPDDDQLVRARGACQRRGELQQRLEPIDVRARNEDRAHCRLCAAPARCRRRGRLEGGVLVEDRALEALQGGARLDPEPVDERGTRGGVDLEGLGLPPRAIQREHELPARTLAQGVLAHEPLELADHLRVVSECEVGVDPVLERGEPQVLEAGDGGLGEGLEREVAERRTAPQRQRASQPRGPGLGVARGQGAATLRRQELETVKVDLLGRGLQAVTRPLRHDHPGVADRFAELRHVHLDAVRRRPWRLAAPELVDQAVDRDRLVRVQEEDREQRTLFRAPE